MPLAERLELAFRLGEEDTGGVSRHPRPRPADGNPTPRAAAPSDPPTERMPAAAYRLSLLERVAATLERAGIAYALIGAAALAVHGSPRDRQAGSWQHRPNSPAIESAAARNQARTRALRRPRGCPGPDGPRSPAAVPPGPTVPGSRRRHRAGSGWSRRPPLAVRRARRLAPNSWTFNTRLRSTRIGEGTLRRRAVEVVTGTEHAHQQLPAGRVLAGFALAHREVGAQQLAAVLQRRLQLRGHRAVVRARVAPWREVPPEHHRRERPEVR